MWSMEVMHSHRVVSMTHKSCVNRMFKQKKSFNNTELNCESLARVINIAHGNFHRLTFILLFNEMLRFFLGIIHIYYWLPHILF